MTSYKRPDVYVEEISTLPPSVAEVSTAIPAFLGYTEKGAINVPKRISTFLEYKDHFGGPAPVDFTITVDSDDNITEVARNVDAPGLKQVLYHAIDLYFKNGGGPCYIVPVGNYTVPVEVDAAAVTAANNTVTTAQADLDTKESTVDSAETAVQDAQDSLATAQNSNPSAVPLAQETLTNAQTALTNAENERDTAQTALAAAQEALAAASSTTAAVIPDVADYEDGLTALEKEDEPTLIVLADAVLTLAEVDYYSIAQQALAQCGKLKDRFAILDVTNSDTDGTKFRGGIGTSDLKYGAAYYPFLTTALSVSYSEEQVTVGSGTSSEALNDITSSKTALYNAAIAALSQERMVLPPSAALAGVYARVDRSTGVWKAPANVSLSSVIEPTERFTNLELDNFNVDATSGKSINIIRQFSGKGTLVWGARTLDGNSNEWRYISVRRLFNTIEESIKKASAFAVFESNNSSTWLKVQKSIEGYLYQLWQKRALVGGTAEQAYFVNVGLGKSMSEQDVLEGRMNVEIGVSAVRPAEFIILKFSHKLQQAA